MIKNWPAIILISIGSLVWSLTMVKSGLMYDFGMGFWGPNGHDGVWHVAIIEHFSQDWNLDSPILAGEKLTNYHFLFDALVALANRMLPLGSVTWYFQIVPPMLAAGIGWAVYYFVRQWTDSKKSAWWSVFFIYFGGSWGWLVNWMRDGSWSGESMFWANQAISTLINPPYALSILMLFGGLSFWLKYQKNPTWKLLILTGSIFGLLIHAKAYAGILALAGLGIVALCEVVKKRRKIVHGQLGFSSLPNAWVWAFSLILTVLTFWPLNKTAANLLVFSPLWFPHTMLEFNDRFNWSQLEQARQAYWATGLWWKALLAEAVALTIFILGNLGSRFVGSVFIARRIVSYCRPELVLGPTVKTLQMLKPASQRGERVQHDKYVDIFLLTILLTAIILPLLFIQKGNPWNTVQFFYYAQVVMAIYAGKVVGELPFEKSSLSSLRKPASRRGEQGSMEGMLEVSWVKLITLFNIRTMGSRLHGNDIFKTTLLIVIVVLTIPTTLDTLQHYLPPRPPAMISHAELEALEFLRRQPEGVVLTYPFDSELRNKYEAPKPLAYYETTAYVAAFSGKPVYLEDEMNLEITGADWRPRREAALEFFETSNMAVAEKFLENNKIKYIYLLKNRTNDLGRLSSNLEKTFENDEVLIYQ